MTLANKKGFRHTLYDAPTLIRREQRMIQYNWPNGNRKYIGYHADIDAEETAPNWEIIKYTVDGLKYEGPRQGAVNTEAVINDNITWKI